MRSTLNLLLAALVGTATWSARGDAKDPAAPPAKEAPKEATAPEAKSDPAADQAKQDSETVKAAGLADEGPALLTYFRQRSVSDADRGKIQALIRKLGDESFDVRESAQEQIEKFGVAAVGLLRQAERDPDTEIALRSERCLGRIEKVPTRALSAAAARLLAKHKPEGTAEVLLAYLPLADDESVADEVRNALAAVAVRGGKPDAALRQALDANEAVRRGAALEAFARAGDKELRADVRKRMEKEKDPDARLRAALALVTAGKEKAVVPELIRLLAELPQDKGWMAEDVLCRIAGESGPNVSLGSDAAARKAAAEAWKGWWEKNEAKVDLAKLDQAPALLGYTLILEMDNRGIGGRVVELGPDGKERWKITGLNFPIDAQVLPGNKVLVAEHNQHRVTERDLTGKILWNKQVLMPVNVQRLPNGHTFVAARNHLYEFDREGKDVLNIQRPQHDIVAAQKARDGQIVMLTNGGQCVRLDKDGKQVKAFGVGRVNYYSGLQLLPNKKVLLTQWNGVAEYDLETGQAGWTAPVNQPTSVMRLPNGNTLVASMSQMKVLELDRQGKTVSEYKPTEANTRPWRAKKR